MPKYMSDNCMFSSVYSALVMSSIHFSYYFELFALVKKTIYQIFCISVNSITFQDFSQQQDMHIKVNSNTLIPILQNMWGCKMKNLQADWKKEFSLSKIKPAL